MPDSFQLHVSHTPPKGNKGKYQITRTQEDLGTSCYCAPLCSCCFQFMALTKNRKYANNKKKGGKVCVLFLFSFGMQARLSSHELRHLRLRKCFQNVKMLLYTKERRQLCLMQCGVSKLIIQENTVHIVKPTS